ncbi:DUF1841 family protein [Neisseria sp. Ec49-e6-T10]|uniref:DUF1841 family protein n=1 Tax=Neisseria sp. Ec49-e6-T10 TaxID=3140744 RepID=UPI003EBF803F
MFNINSTEVRRFFAQVWQLRSNGQLDALQKKALAIILEHPEYQHFLDNIDAYLDTQWLPENGETNPFLHMSLHLSLQEQCVINQPPGIADIAQQLAQKHDGIHEAEHVMMDALVEMIWQAQRHKTGFDVNLYVTQLRQTLNLSEEEQQRVNPHEV